MRREPWKANYINEMLINRYSRLVVSHIHTQVYSS